MSAWSLVLGMMVMELEASLGHSLWLEGDLGIGLPSGDVEGAAPIEPGPDHASEELGLKGQPLLLVLDVLGARWSSPCQFRHSLKALQGRDSANYFGGPPSWILAMARSCGGARLMGS